jgi:hypothetical protein
MTIPIDNVRLRAMTFRRFVGRGIAVAILFLILGAAVGMIAELRAGQFGVTAADLSFHRESTGFRLMGLLSFVGLGLGAGVVTLGAFVALLRYGGVQPIGAAHREPKAFDADQGAPRR